MKDRGACQVCASCALACKQHKPTEVCYCGKFVPTPEEVKPEMEALNNGNS